MVWVAGEKLYGNRYIIERQIGEGGFGITYLAKNRRGEQVVIKTLKDEVMTNPDFTEFRDKFKDEAMRLAICKHPHIVQIENFFAHQSLPCIAMEYVEGEDLWRRVKTGGVLSEAEGLRYIQQIGEALTVVHEKGLLHRDLKPQNIMLRSRQSEAVLIDFGIAREFIPDVTLYHTAYVSLGFEPIEQHYEEAHRGEWTDVYSLAATLYYLLTGKMPEGSLMRVRRDRLIPPRQHNQGISEVVSQAIVQGMAVQPEDRPASVQEWLKLLQAGRSRGGLPFRVFQFDVVTVNAQGKEINRRQQQGQFLPEDLGGGVILEMVAIPGGSFVMGSLDDEPKRDNYESPRHLVDVAAFLMGKFPVTQAQWRAVAELPKINTDLDPDPSRFKGANRPVEQVSWHEAMEFCGRLSKKTGRNYRLPSEAEWEYACRAGTNTPFHFGETITTDLANYDGNYVYGAASKGKYREETTPVGSFKVANAFGLYDMHGNIWEWCADGWHDNYEGAPSDGGIWLSSDGINIRVLRGGSWGYNPSYCRSAVRSWSLPGIRRNGCGFRAFGSVV